MGRISRSAQFSYSLTLSSTSVESRSDYTLGDAFLSPFWLFLSLSPLMNLNPISSCTHSSVHLVSHSTYWPWGQLCVSYLRHPKWNACIFKYMPVYASIYMALRGILVLDLEFMNLGASCGQKQMRLTERPKNKSHRWSWMCSQEFSWQTMEEMIPYDVIPKSEAVLLAVRMDRQATEHEM